MRVTGVVLPVTVMDEPRARLSATKETPLAPELWRAADVVTDAQEMERLPEVVIDPDGFVNDPLPEQLKAKVLVAEELMAADTAMFPWLLRVALPVLN